MDGTGRIRYDVPFDSPVNGTIKFLSPIVLAPEPCGILLDVKQDLIVLGQDCDCPCSWAGVNPTLPIAFLFAGYSWCSEEVGGDGIIIYPCWRLRSCIVPCAGLLSIPQVIPITPSS